LVREEDAAAFVVDVAVMLKLSGRDPPCDGPVPDEEE
jgi:hypothetical protein